MVTVRPTVVSTSTAPLVVLRVSEVALYVPEITALVVTSVRVDPEYVPEMRPLVVEASTEPAINGVCERHQQERNTVHDQHVHWSLCASWCHGERESQK